MKTGVPVYISKGALVIYWLMFTFWFLGVYPFLIQLDSYQLFLNVDGNVTIFFEGCYIALGLLLLRNRWDKAVVYGFIAIAFISTVLVNGLPVKEWLNGLRFYAPMVFLLPVVRYAFATRPRREFFMELMDRSLYVFLWLQVPCMLYQLIVYGGWDYGGGSLGFYQSGLISELIYVISFYLMLRRWDYSKNYFRNLVNNWILLFLLFPSFLNETKVSLVYIVFYFLLLVPVNRKFVKSMLITLPLLCFMIWLFNYFYMSVYGSRTESGEILTMEYFDYYVIGDEASFDIMELAYENADDSEDTDFQRGLKWVALPWLMDDHGAESWIWGNGTGILKGHSNDDPSEFAIPYGWLFQGTIMTLYMLILEIGIVGVVWFVFTYVVLFRKAAGRRRQKQLVLYLIGLLITVIVYNTSMNYFFFTLVFYYLAYVSLYWEDAKVLGNISQSGSMISVGGVFKKVEVKGSLSDYGRKCSDGQDDSGNWL